MAVPSRNPSVKSAGRLQSFAPPDIFSWTCQRYAFRTKLWGSYSVFFFGRGGVVTGIELELACLENTSIKCTAAFKVRQFVEGSYACGNCLI